MPILEAVCGDPDRTSLRKLMNLLLEGLWMSALDHENPTKSGNWLTLNNTDSGSWCWGCISAVTKYDEIAKKVTSNSRMIKSSDLFNGGGVLWRNISSSEVNSKVKTSHGRRFADYFQTLSPHHRRPPGIAIRNAAASYSTTHMTMTLS